MADQHILRLIVSQRHVPITTARHLREVLPGKSCGKVQIAMLCTSLQRIAGHQTIEYEMPLWTLPARPAMGNKAVSEVWAKPPGISQPLIQKASTYVLADSR